MPGLNFQPPMTSGLPALPVAASVETFRFVVVDLQGFGAFRGTVLRRLAAGCAQSSDSESSSKSATPSFMSTSSSSDASSKTPESTSAAALGEVQLDGVYSSGGCENPLPEDEDEVRCFLAE